MVDSRLLGPAMTTSPVQVESRIAEHNGDIGGCEDDVL
jgi:hypothetical protein